MYLGKGLTALLMSVTIVGSAASAEIEVQQWHGDWDDFTIWGKISPADEAAFRSRVIEQLKNGRLINRVNIYSVGGDVNTALKIGAEIRALKIPTQAPKFLKSRVLCFTGPRNRQTPQKPDAVCQCQSACFLAWAGGVGRYGDVIGVHRPKLELENGDLRVVDFEKKYSSLERRLRLYFLEMDVPEWAASKLFETVEMSYFSRAQLAALNNEPPSLRELISSKCQSRPSTDDGVVAEVFDECSLAVRRDFAIKAALEYLLIQGK